MDSDILTPERGPDLALEPGRPARRPVVARAVVRVTGAVGASPERVFDAWLDPAVAGKWLFATAWRPIVSVDLDARVGGSFRFVERLRGKVVEHTGEYLEIVRPRRLVFTLSLERDPEARTRVITEIVPRDGGCEIAIAHENVPLDDAIRTENRWTGMLYGLGATLASSMGR